MNADTFSNPRAGSPPPRQPSRPIYRFLDVQAEPLGNRLILADGEVRSITPRAMDVLVYLLQSPGRVVSKKELLAAVWQQQAVTDDALVVTIYELRKALGDNARRPIYVQTVVRRGYRFLPEVEVVAEISGAKILGTDPVAGEEPAEKTPATPWTAWVAMPRAHLAAAGAVLLWLLLGSLAWGPSWFEVGSHGSQAPAAYSDTQDGNRFEELSIVEGQRLAAARALLESRRPEDLAAADGILHRLTRRRGGHPRVSAAVARLAALRADLRLGDRFHLYHQARSWAERGLGTDPRAVDAHLALAIVELIMDWNGPAANRSLQKALAAATRAQDISTVEQTRSWLLSASGDHVEARLAAERSVELDPESSAKRSDLAFVLLFAGDLEAADREARRVLSRDPRQMGAWAVLIRSRLITGDLAAAQKEQLNMLTRLGTPVEALNPWYQMTPEQGFWPLNRKILAPAAGQKDRGQSLVSRAGAQAHLGDIDQALALLERAAERRDWEILWLEQLPELKPLHGEARFQDLLARRGLLGAPRVAELSVSKRNREGSS